MHEDFSDNQDDMSIKTRNGEQFMLDDLIDEPDVPDESYDELSIISTSSIVVPIAVE